MELSSWLVPPQLFGSLGFAPIQGMNHRSRKLRGQGFPISADKRPITGNSEVIHLDKKTRYPYKWLAVIGKFSGTVRAFVNQNIFERSVTLRSSMRSLQLIMITLFSALTLIIVVTREPTCASAFLPQQPAVSGGRTLTPAGVSALHAIADSARNENLRWPDFAPYKTEFSKFYEANGYSLAWLQNGQVRPQGLAVIEVLENANSRGLEPEDYDASRWPMRLSKLRQSPSEEDLVLFDTALTVSA